MTRVQLNRAVARITGETLDTIRRRGFGLLSRKPRRSNKQRNRDDQHRFPPASAPQLCPT
jgi:hypothetical protein